MSLNCRLSRNITLSQPSESGGTDSCNSIDMSMGIGGIANVVVYNIDDVKSLKFKNDMRPDDSLEVDTINSIGAFYTIDFSTATYNEEYDAANKWTHSLQLQVSNITNLFEDILSDGVNGKYLVCFRPKGSEDYKCFGWKYGASLDYSMQIQDDSYGYTITLQDESEYPLFSVYADNFGAKNKVYTPVFVPRYDLYFCEEINGHYNGYSVAMYVEKQNAVGQPLDADNHLCQWSGKKQDAYKYFGIESDENYNIIGTYNGNAEFDGKPVKVMDKDKCPYVVDDSIFVNGEKQVDVHVNNVAATSTTVTIDSTDAWRVITSPQYCAVTPSDGASGTTTVTIIATGGEGGMDGIDFQNIVTQEVVEARCNVYTINISNQSYEYGTTEFVLTPSVRGGSGDYTFSVSPTLSVTKDGNGYLICRPSVSDTTQVFTFRFEHADDTSCVKTIEVVINGNNTNPNWQLLSSHCEIPYSGYRIDEYMDVNPQSPTYQNQRQERVLDSNCNEAQPIWTVVQEYCETNASGVNTGYYVTVEQDTNPQSPTYGVRRTSKVMDLAACPEQSTAPNWVEMTSYCETTTYQPSGVEGNTGYLIRVYRDDNRYSPTWKSEKIEKELSSNCPKYVDCTLFNFSDLGASAPAIYNTQNIVTYNVNDGVKLKVFSKPDWIYKIVEWDMGNYQRLVAHISNNPNLQERVGEVALVSESGNCTFVATVTQSGATPCSEYHLETFDTYFDTSGGTKTIASYATSAETQNQGIDIIEVPTWVSQVHKVTDGDTIRIECTVPKNYDAERSGRVSLVSEDRYCSAELNISQAEGQDSECEQYGFKDLGITIPSSGGTVGAGVCSAYYEEFILVEKPYWVTDIQYHFLAGRRSKSIDITVDANTASYPREGIITLKGQEMDCTFTLNFTQLSL